MRNVLVNILLLFCFITSSIYVHSAAIESPLDFPYQKGVGYLHAIYGIEATTGSNALLLTPDKCLCTSHALYNPTHATPTNAFVIFHENPSIVLKDTEKFPSVKADLDLSTAQHHPHRDLCIVTLKKPLADVPILPLSLERPLRSPLRTFSLSFSKTDMAGTPTKGLHAYPMEVQEMMVPWPEKAILYFVMPGHKDSSGNLIHSRPGDSGAPLFVTETGVIGLLHGTYTYKQEGDTTTTATLITPLNTDGIPAWIRWHTQPGVLSYIRSLFGC